MRPLTRFGGGVEIVAQGSDTVGNRLTLTAGGTTSTYAYSTTANQIATITTGGTVRSFIYLASGQVSQDQRNTSNIYTFAANDNGRNGSAALNSTTVGIYLYNAFEQRVQKTAGATVTQFVFDRFGHLLEEANASGAAQKEYIWLDDTPVAVVDDTGASPVLYYIHTDQLGTPQKITDSSGVIVWDGVFDPFGNAQFTSGGGVWDTSLWDNFLWGGSLALTNLRFPGQYADAETALNQNWFRDYDPTIGRYIQSDPVGLLSGINTCTYVNGRPIIERDPNGEFVWVIAGVAVGAVTGGYAGYEAGGWWGAAVGGAIGAAVGAVAPSVSAAAAGAVTGTAAQFFAGTAALSALGAAGGAAGTMALNYHQGCPLVKGLGWGIGLGLFAPLLSGEAGFVALGRVGLSEAYGPAFSAYTGAIGVAGAAITPTEECICQ